MEKQDTVAIAKISENSHGLALSKTWLHEGLKKDSLGKYQTPNQSYASVKTTIWNSSVCSPSHTKYQAHGQTDTKSQLVLYNPSLLFGCIRCIYIFPAARVHKDSEVLDYVSVMLTGKAIVIGEFNARQRTWENDGNGKPFNPFEKHIKMIGKLVPSKLNILHYT